MECDVIPDCSQDVDPLGNLANCDALPTPDDAHVFTLDAQIVSSNDATITYVQSLLPASSPSRPGPAPAPPQSLLHVRHSAPKAPIIQAPPPTVVTPTRRKTTKTPTRNTAKKNIAARTSSAPSKAREPPPGNDCPATSTTTQQSSITQASTMREVLASIPGFSIKPRRRTSKKMSTAAQIAQTREGCIDLETPDSILVGANLRSLLNKHTFLMLPPLFQYKLVQLLPGVDRPPIDPDDPNAGIRLNASSLNNEFFARACLEWRDRLSEGEFTPENQMKLRADAEKEKSKLDPWKLRHFEPIWGRDKNHSDSVRLDATSEEFRSSPPESSIECSASGNATAPGGYTTTSSGRTVRHPSTFNSVASSGGGAQKRSPRTVGAMTRASAAAVVCQDAPTEATVPPTVRIKTPRVLDMSVPEEVNKEDPEQPILIEDDIDTIVIPDDDPISTTSEMTVTITSSSSVATPKSHIPTTTTTTVYQIPPGIEVIPLDSSSRSSNAMIKRAQKRTNSPDRNQIKISKFNENNSNSQPAHHHHHHHHHHHPPLHKRSPIPSKPSPPDNSSHHNGSSCAVSDVIQIIKLPKDSSAQQQQQQQQHHHPQTSSDKQSSSSSAAAEDNHSKLWMLDTTLPSMSVTTIPAPTNDIYHQQQPAAPHPQIEIIKRSSMKHNQTQPDPPSPHPTPSPASMFVKGSFDPHLDTDLDDADEEAALLAESAADHVFRAMVCHGDDVLCGDGTLTTIDQEDEVAPAAKPSSVDCSIYGQSSCSYNEPPTTITLDDSPPPVVRSTSPPHPPPPPPPTEEDEPNSDRTADVVVIISDDRSMEEVEEQDQCDGVPPGPETNDPEQMEHDDEPQPPGLEAAVEEELEPSIQNLVELMDPIEQEEFNDAENYVLESGEISADSGETTGLAVSAAKISGDGDTVQENLFAAALAQARDRVPSLDPANTTSALPPAPSPQSIVVETQQRQQQQLPGKYHIMHQQQQQQQQQHQNHHHHRIHAAATETEVIPMQETLELRLKERTYPSAAAANWSYKMEGRIMAAAAAAAAADQLAADNSRADHYGTEEEDAAAGGGPNNDGGHSEEDDSSHQQHQRSMVLLSQPANSYETTSQVKLELEVTLTPEAEVSSSTLASQSSNSGGPLSSFGDSDQSNEEEQRVFRSSSTSSTSMAPNVIPPTTIVCLPSPMGGSSFPCGGGGDTAPMQTTYITSSNFDAISKGNTAGQSTVVFTNNHIQRPPVSQSLPPASTTQSNLLPYQSTVAASSSSLPYLSLAATQPLRAVHHRPKIQPVSGKSGGRGSRGNSNRPPPGAVNLERSYQICQAVIQSSPNRHQLKAQLRPPPSMLSTGGVPAHPSPPPPAQPQQQQQGSTGPIGNAQGQMPSKKDEPTKAAIHPPRVAFAKKPSFIQRQPSPVLVRHVFTTSQGIPVSMAVLPAGMHPGHHQLLQQTQPPIQYRMATGGGANNNNNNGNVMSAADMIASGGGGGGAQSGQYILVQRTPGLISADIPAPRSSSAPPAQQHQLQRSGHAPAIGARGRPASVDIDGILLDGGGGSDESQSPESDSPAYGEHVVQSQHHPHQQQHNLQQQQQQLYHHQQQQQQLLLEQQHGNLKVANTSNVSSMNSGFSSYAPELLGTAAAADGAAAHHYAQPHQFVAAGENTPPTNCSCSLNAMVICQQCGIFCHDQCMGSAKLCLSCVIR